MLKTVLMTAIAGVLLTTGSVKAQTFDESPQGRAMALFSEIAEDADDVREVTRQIKNNETTCDSDKAVTAQVNLLTMRDSASLFPVVSARTARLLSSLWTTVQLDFADAALEKGCLDVADKEYREIIKTYTARYDGPARQRAQIGIDDIRAKR